MQKITRYSLWLVSLLGTFGTYAQSTGILLDDLAYALEDTTNRREVFSAMQAFHTHTQVGLAVATVYENGSYAASSQGDITQWLGQQTHGITLFITVSEQTKAFQACQMRVSEAVEVLLPLEDREQIQKGLLEFYFRNSPIPSNAYTSGLLAGIAAMEKKILENRANEKEKLPDDVVRITHVDKEFSAGIDNDKLKIEYAIQKEYVGKLKAAKLEVYKNVAKEPCFVKALSIEEAGTYLWDGKLSEKEGDYIAYKDSPFTIKITVSEDEEFEKVGADEEEGWVDKEADEFRLYADFAKKHVGGNRPAWTTYNYYKAIRKDIHDEIKANIGADFRGKYNSNPLAYYATHVEDKVFLGQKIPVHQNFYKVLQSIENDITGAVGNKYTNNKEYLINNGSFKIRFQNSKDIVSEHAYGMAMDIDVPYNPQLYLKPLFLISVLTRKTICREKSSVEEMKQANNSIKSLNLSLNAVENIYKGFEVIDTCISSVNSITIDDMSKMLAEGKEIISEVRKLHQEAIYLSNERHFFSNSSRYTEEQVKQSKQRFYTGITQDCVDLKQRTEALIKSYSIQEISHLMVEGYGKAMLLNQHFPSIFQQLEQDLSSLKKIKEMIEVLDDLILLTSNRKIPSNYNNIANITISLNGQTSDLKPLLDWIELVNIKHTIAFKEVKSYVKLLQWLKNGSVYSFYSNQSLSTNAFFVEVSKVGFFRLSKEFVRFFTQPKYEGNIRWGGFYYRSSKDWMHFELINPNRLNPNFELKTN